MAVDAGPHAPSSSEPHGRMTVTRARPRSSSTGGVSAAARTNSAIRQTALAWGTGRPARGIGHGARAGVHPDDQRAGYGGGSGEHGASVARAYSRSPAPRGRSGPRLTDVHVRDATTGDDAHRALHRFVRSRSLHSLGCQLAIGPYARLAPRLLSDGSPDAASSRRPVRRPHHRPAPDLVVEHIGSTSVPGLPGKGIVDLGDRGRPEPTSRPSSSDALRPGVPAAARSGPVAADAADARRLDRPWTG